MTEKTVHEGKRDTWHTLLKLVNPVLCIMLTILMPLLSAISGFAVVLWILDPGAQELLSNVAQVFSNAENINSEKNVRIEDQLRLGVTVFGGGVAIASIRELTRQIPSLATFLKDRKLADLLSPCLAIFVASASLSLSLWALVNKPEADVAPTSRPPQLQVFFEPTDLMTKQEGPLATFIVTFDEDATVESINQKKGAGLTISAAYADLLEAIADTLLECGATGTGPVRLKTIGMASSEPFDDLPLASSNRMNRDLANLRAQLVADRIMSFAPESSLGNNFLVIPYEWVSYEDMVQARRFRDRDLDGNYLESRARLTRRVEVVLESGGGCEFETP